MSGENDDAARRKAAIAEYRKKMLSHKELDVRVRSGNRNHVALVFCIYLSSI